jgi:AcrR family transcriptional regulator
MVSSIDESRRANGATPATDTYRTILTAAREVFRTRGYNAATVDDLRRAAGVSRATFYFYFQDRREVITRLLSETTRQFHELYQRPVPHSDEYTSIVTSNVAYIAHYSRDYDIFMALRGVMDDPKIRGMVEDVRSGFRQRVERKIWRLVDSGRIQPVDPAMMARILIGMVESFTQQFFSIYTTKEEVRANLPAAVQHVSETWYRAVYVEDPPRPFPYDEFIAQAEFGPLVRD